MIVALGGALVTSCDEWTEPESLNIDFKTVDTDPNYAAYLADLCKYRSTEHTQVYAWVDAPADNATTQAHRLTAVPDSVDVIVLMSPNAVSQQTLGEMQQVREKKGMKVVYTIDYNDFKASYTSKVELATPENPAPTLVKFLTDSLTTALGYAKTVGFDGVMFAYDGKATNHLNDTELAAYNAEQSLFFNIVADWHSRFPAYSIDYLGYPQYLTNQDLVDEFGYLFVRQGMQATNADLFSYYLTLASDGIAPADKLGMMVTCTSIDPVDVKTGWFSDGTLAIQGFINWAKSADVAAIGIYNAYTDYFNGADSYINVRNAIQAVNPSVK